MTFFVSSVGLSKGADLGGLEGADKHCQTLAQGAGVGSKTWHAYLSTQAVGTGEDKILTVTYDKDQSKTIAVPPKAPIVAFETADKTILKPGAKIFVVAAKDGGKLDGKFVAIGKDGLTPPM